MDRTSIGTTMMKGSVNKSKVVTNFNDDNYDSIGDESTPDLSS